ncbi:hypothetical protein SFRURICE_014653 [Spodoptera frugiperda]|nr:hypothetical protein SFRURICE_014653 [Spodoptera frugiperda]
MEIKEIELVTGKKYCMLGDYTYTYLRMTKNGWSKWRCTKTAQCCAFFEANESERPRRLVKVSGTHNHEPPKYQLTASGKYVKV